MKKIAGALSGITAEVLGKNRMLTVVNIEAGTGCWFIGGERVIDNFIYQFRLMTNPMLLAWGLLLERPKVASAIFF
ncbi:TPA: hypothetical protein RG501_RS12845 [Providencia rettgeri]|nr:hypothetical protein [Providencia rettgeri]